MLLPRAVGLLLLVGCSLVSCTTQEPLRSIPDTEECPSKCMCIPKEEGMMDVVCPTEEDINDLKNPPEDIGMQTAVEIINVAEVNNDTRPEEATGEEPEAEDASVENTEQPMPVENKSGDKETIALDGESKTEDSAPLSFPEDIPVEKEVDDKKLKENDIMQADEPEYEEEVDYDEFDKYDKEVPVETTGDSDAKIVAKKGQNLGLNLNERTPPPSMDEQGDQPVVDDDENELQEDSGKEAEKTEGDVEPESQTDEINVAEVKENADSEKKDDTEISKPVDQDFEDEYEEEEEEETPVENEEKPVETPEEKPVESPEDKIVETPEEKIEDTPEETEEKPVETPEEIPVETDFEDEFVDEDTEDNNDTPVENNENPVEKPESENSSEKVEVVEEQIEAKIASDTAVAPVENESSEESSEKTPEDDKSVEDKKDPEVPLVFPSKTDNSSEEENDSTAAPAAVLISRMKGSDNPESIILPDGEVLLTGNQLDDSMSGKMISDDENTTTDPQQSTASWVILGLILATFVCVLGYAAIRGRMDKKEEELVSTVKPTVIDPKINRKPEFEGTELKVLSHPLLQPQDDDNVKEFKDDGTLEQVVIADNSDPNTFPFIDAPNSVSKPPRKAPRPLSVDLPSPSDMSRNDFVTSPQSTEPTTPTLVRAKMVDHSPQVARIVRNVNETKIEEEDEE